MPSLRSALLALATAPIATAQLMPVGALSYGQKPHEAALATPTSFPTSPTTSSSSSTITPPPVTAPYDPLVLNTVFTQPDGCDVGITQIAAWSTELWQNVVNPLPTLTYSSCYPSQFYSSAVATTVMPPFKELVCPLYWNNYIYNDTYIICCPKYVSDSSFEARYPDLTQAVAI